MLYLDIIKNNKNMKKLENVNEIKKSLFNNVFDGFCNDELGVNFDNDFNKIVGFKEDVDGWGKDYYVCVDKDNNILFDWVSINDKEDDKWCCNNENGLFFNIKRF
jgi:hypothetical protein